MRIAGKRCSLINSNLLPFLDLVIGKLLRTRNYDLTFAHLHKRNRAWTNQFVSLLPTEIGLALSALLLWSINRACGFTRHRGLRSLRSAFFIYVFHMCLIGLIWRHAGHRIDALQGSDWKPFLVSELVVFLFFGVLWGRYFIRGFRRIVQDSLAMWSEDKPYCPTRGCGMPLPPANGVCPRCNNAYSVDVRYIAFPAEDVTDELVVGCDPRRNGM